MNITRMNVLDIMTESLKTSVVNTDNETIDEMAATVLSHIESIDEVDFDVEFRADQVPVICGEDGKYYVEYEMLEKLRECDDTISLDTKYGKISFSPKQDDCKMDEPGDEVVTEEEPEDTTDIDTDNEIDESFWGDPSWTPIEEESDFCWVRNALEEVFWANYGSNEMAGRPEMTFENTYVVIESDDEFADRISEVTEAAKSGGVAMKNGKAQLKKTDNVFKNMLNNGLKVVKKKSKKKGKKKKKTSKKK